MLLKADGRKVIVFNVSGDDYKDMEVEEMSWDPELLQDIQNCCVVFEDLIGPSHKKLTTIKKVVHYFQRRRNVSLYVLSHEIHHTGLYSLIGQMDKIYVTSGPKNAKLYRDLGKFQFRIEPSTLDALKAKEYHYLELNPKTGSCRILNSKLEDVMGSLRNDLMAKRSEVEKCLKAFPRQCVILMQIFDIIFKNFSSSLLTPNDLCIPINVGPSSRSRTRKVPIIDFLLSLRMAQRPDSDVLRLKKLIDSKMTLPRTLITNAHLRSTNGGSSVKRAAPAGSSAAASSRIKKRSRRSGGRGSRTSRSGPSYPSGDSSSSSYSSSSSASSTSSRSSSPSSVSSSSSSSSMNSESEYSPRTGGPGASAATAKS